MAKPPTFPTVIDGLATVTISFLKSRNYLSAPGHKAGLVEWTRNGRPAGSIAIEVIMAEASAELIMKYRSNGVYKEHRVPIVSRVSPFGGLIWLFVCPVTGLKGRNLYENSDLFTHRAALGQAMYYCQTISKPHRELVKEFAEYRLQGLGATFYKKYAKRMYRGKFTRRYISYLKKAGLFDEFKTRAGPQF
ncbi:MAG: hypothetical protein KF870_07305 [Leadbetterella sp.]|nr:hypothetical protein [Leadbetterella sp.]